MTSFNAASIFNMAPKKGTLQPGADADLCLVDLELEKTVDAAELGSYSDFSVFEGRRLKGWPVLTMLRGEVIAQDGRIVGEPTGEYLMRNGFLSEGE